MKMEDSETLRGVRGDGLAQQNGAALEASASKDEGPNLSFGCLSGPALLM